MTEAVSEAPDRIRLALSFDSARLVEAVQALQLSPFVHYDVQPLRAPAHLVDPTRAPPPPATDHADGTWTEWLDTPLLQKSPAFAEVVDRFRLHTRVTLVRLLRLAPGAVVDPHRDPTLGLEQHRSVIRLTVPILTNPGVQFFLNDVPVPMSPGSCWYLRLSDEHRVVNAGTTERVSMTLDMAPNRWVKTQLGVA